MAPDPRTFGETIEVPLISPQFLNWAMKAQSLIQGAAQWIQGLFDPVDFLIIDPLGRRLGFLQSTGLLREIPNAFYSGDGGVEQFLIPNPIPGTYMIRLEGVGEEAFAAIETSETSRSHMKYMAPGDIELIEVVIEPKVGVGGDVDYDGDVDVNDIVKLISLLGTSTDAPGHPGDLDGDGLLSIDDLDLLTMLVEILNVKGIPTLNQYGMAILALLMLGVGFVGIRRFV